MIAYDVNYDVTWLSDTCCNRVSKDITTTHRAIHIATLPREPRHTSDMAIARKQ